MSKKLLFSIIVILLITNIASLILWSRDAERNEKTLKDAVAIIDGDPIYYEELHRGLIEKYGENELKSQINHRIVAKLAEEQKIAISPKLIERELSLLTTTLGVMDEEKYQAQKDRWEENIIYRLQLEQLLTRDIIIPEEEIKQYYDTYGDHYDFIASLQLSHILVPDMKMAEKVKSELNQGASFPLLAQEYSQDEETKSIGGYLGFLPITSQFLEDDYVRVAEGMKENHYSEPFHTEKGVAIIFLHRKLDSIEFTYEEVKPYIHSELAMQQNESLTAESLWEHFEIEWLYEE